MFTSERIKWCLHQIVDEPIALYPNFVVILNKLKSAEAEISLNFDNITPLAILDELKRISSFLAVQKGFKV